MFHLKSVLSPLRTCFASALLLFLIPNAAAQQASVTLYGLLDLGITYEHVRRDAVKLPPAPGAVDEALFGVSNGVQSGSRWGLRGVAPLGSGVHIDFVLEGGINPADGVASQDGRLFGRQSTMGLVMQNVGRLDIGRQINLASNYFLNIDPFSEGFGQANMGSSFGTANTSRYGNLVLLQVKPFGGLTIGAGYSFATQQDAIYAAGRPCAATQSCSAQAGAYYFSSNQNLRALTLGAHFKSGPLEAAVSYDRMYGDASKTEGSAEPSAWVLGGAYDLKFMRVSVAVGRTNNGLFNGQASGSGSVTPSGLETASWVGGAVLFLPGTQASSTMLGVSVPLSGQSTLLASWQMMQPGGLFANDALYKTQQVYSAALSQQLSARTNFYAYTSYGQNYGMVNSAESFMVGVGMRHTF